MSLQLTAHTSGHEPSLPFLHQFLDEAQVGFLYLQAAQWCERVGVDSIEALRMHGADFCSQDFCRHLLSFTRARIDQALEPPAEPVARAGSVAPAEPVAPMEPAAPVEPPRKSGDCLQELSSQTMEELSSQTTSDGGSGAGSESLRSSINSFSVGARVNPLAKVVGAEPAQPNGGLLRGGSSVVPMATLDTTGDGLVDSVALDTTGDGNADTVQPMQFRGGHGATRAERVAASKLAAQGGSAADIKRERRMTAMQQGDVGIDTTGDGLIDTVALDTTGDGQIDTVRPLTFAPTTMPQNNHGDI